MRFSRSTHLLMSLSLEALTSIIRTGYCDGTDRPGELCYNFSISNGLTQMLNFPTRIPDCHSHSPAFLDLFCSSDASICFAVASPPLGNSDHVVVAVSIDFPSTGCPISLHSL